jgi:hypothetical protein
MQSLLGDIASHTSDPVTTIGIQQNRIVGIERVADDSFWWYPLHDAQIPRDKFSLCIITKGVAEGMSTQPLVQRFLESSPNCIVDVYIRRPTEFVCKGLCPGLKESFFLSHPLIRSAPLVVHAKTPLCLECIWRCIVFRFTMEEMHKEKRRSSEAANATTTITSQ